ncbi:MAG TPA: heparin lyase I family protein [Polyangia bacterium]|nr:heparin lyase I family protein [Polyangia bacterium]
MRISLFFVASALVAGAACSPRLNLGSDLLWAAHHETGDLKEWTGDQKGGASGPTPYTSVNISTDYAHGGKYAVKLSNAAISDYEEARLWRNDQYPQSAFYSAWYYLPRGYQTTNDWTIMQLRVPPTVDGGSLSQLLDVDLRSLPGGTLILSVYDHRPQYLRAATPDPAVTVPIGRWFQVQALFDDSSGPDGRFVLWLDDQVLYDLQRPFNVPEGIVYFSVCSVSEALSPPDSAIYVDDATVSLTRVGPDAAL